MSELTLLRRLAEPNDTKIVLLIMDGLGGLPLTPDGLTELESARRPNMNALANKSSLGLTIPVMPGITAGSGPGHLAIFGYDPIENEIGRGALEALGIDFDLRPEDVAARGNFCTLASDGTISDRRAGRLSTPEAMRVTRILNTIKVDGAEIYVEPVKEHRFVLVLRGVGLGCALSETDPLKTGAAPLKASGNDPASEKTAAIVNEFAIKAQIELARETPANGILLRGFDKLPVLPTFQELYKLNPAAIAINGMYKGVARLAGMQILPVIGTSIADEITTLEHYWSDFDFFYIHIKQTDTAGEDGDFKRKVSVIEEIDSLIPRITALNPDVFIISGDHSSPALLKFHSWHPVPTLLYSPHARPDGITEFGERSCLHGSLGILPAKHIMPLALAHAHRIAKYGA